MKIIDALLGEHAIFYTQFDHLENSVPAAETVAQVKSQGAMLTVALASHARLEEELLFRTLEPHIGAMGPLAVMRNEHDQIEMGLERLPTIPELAQMRAQLLQVIAIAREHFTKEEQILFQIASQTLSIETLTDLGAQWAERRAIFLE